MKTNFKTIAITFAILISIVSCKKTEPAFKLAETQKDTTHWYYHCKDGGEVPQWGTTKIKNELYGTNWIVTEVKTGFPTITTHPNDEVHFINNYQYTINSLVTTMGNSNLNLQKFKPINKLTLTCKNIGSGIFSSCSVGGELPLTFNDDYSNIIYQSKFKKL